MAVPVPPVSCAACGKPLPPELLNRDAPEPCPSCRRPVLALAFPAILGRGAGTSVPAATTDGQAECFVHAGRVAVAACDACGRFMCALCDVESGGKHMCAACFSSELENKGREGKGAQRLIHSGIALRLALYPLLFFPLTLITAPVALFWVVRAWRRPAGLDGWPRVTAVLAGLIALAQIVAWIAFISLVVIRMAR